jgi:PKD repeat protein
MTRRRVALWVWIAIVAGSVLWIAGCDALWPLQAVISLQSPASGNAALTVQFSSAASTGSIVQRSWNFGDPTSGASNVSSLATLTHTFADDGVYTVTLTVVDGEGKTSRATTTVVALNPPPQPQLKPYPSSGPAPLTVTFDLASSVDPAGIIPAPGGRIVSFLLDFGDGSPPAVGEDLSAPVIHTYSSPEYRVASLTAVDDDGDTATATRLITVQGAITTLNAPGSYPAGLAYDGASLWVSDAGSRRIDKVRPSDGQVLLSFDAPGEATAPLSNQGIDLQGIVPAPTPGTPGGVAWGGGGLWVACLSDGKIYKLNPNLPTTDPGHVLAVLENTAYKPSALAYGGGALWVGDLSNHRIHKVDPASGVVLRSFDSPGIAPHGLAPRGIVAMAPMGISWADGVLWIASGSVLYKVHPETGGVITYVEAPGAATVGLAYDGRYLWVMDQNGASLGRLYRMVIP